MGAGRGTEPPPCFTERITAFSSTNAITPIASPTTQRSTRRRPFGFFGRSRAAHADRPLTPSGHAGTGPRSWSRDPGRRRHRRRGRPARRAGRRSPAAPCRPVGRAGSKPRPSSVTAKHKRMRLARRSITRRRGRRGVLRDVLHRLEAREVHGRLDVLRVAADRRRRGPRPADPTSAPAPRAPRTVPCPRAAAGRCRGPDRGGPPAPRASRPGAGRASSRAFGASRSIRPSASLSLTASATSCCCAPSWMLRSSRRRSSSCAETSRFCAAFRSSSRRLERLGQPDVAQHETGLRGEVARSASRPTARRDRSPACGPRARPAARPPARPGTRDPSLRSGASTRSGARSASGRAPRSGQAATSRSSRSTASHTSARSAPMPSPEDPRHPRQHVLVRIRPSDALGELRQHLVRCRAFAVHEPVREPREPRACRLERDRHDARPRPS